MRCAFAQMLGAALLLTLALPAPQEIEIKGASIADQGETTPVEIITLENRRASPLVAWH
jgi:hypothetical protein